MPQAHEASARKEGGPRTVPEVSEVTLAADSGELAAGTAVSPASADGEQPRANGLSHHGGVSAAAAQAPTGASPASKDPARSQSAPPADATTAVHRPAPASNGMLEPQQQVQERQRGDADSPAAANLAGSDAAALVTKHTYVDVITRGESTRFSCLFLHDLDVQRRHLSADSRAANVPRGVEGWSVMWEWWCDS